MIRPGEIWSADLTDAQLRLLIHSGENMGTEEGNLVEVRGRSLVTARNLQGKGVGAVLDETSPPALYINNAEGVRILHEFDELEDEALINLALKIAARGGAVPR